MTYYFPSKHVLAIFFLFCFTSQFKAQVIGNITKNSIAGYNLVLIPEREPQKLEGSPFLTEDFVKGKVIIPDKPNFDTFLRYNVSAEYFEIKTHPSSPKIYRLPHSSRATYELYPDQYSWRQLEMEDKNYSGYFIVHYEGKKYSIMEKKVAKFYKGRIASTSYDRDTPPRIDINNKFFVVSSLSQAKEITFNRRKLRKIFPSKEVKKYLRQHKIKDREDLVEFVQFIDQHNSRIN